MSLYFGASHHVLFHWHLDLCWYIRGRVADFNCCLQETKIASILELVSHNFFFTGYPTVGGDVLRCSRIRWHSLVPPGHPPQLPKEKEKNCHQGQPTHNNYYCKEADGQVYRNRKAGSDIDREEGKDMRQHQGQQRDKGREKKNGCEKSVKVWRKQKDDKTKLLRLIKWVFELKSCVKKKSKLFMSMVWVFNYLSGCVGGFTFSNLPQLQWIAILHLIMLFIKDIQPFFKTPSEINFLNTLD